MCNIVHVSCMYLFQQSAKTKDKKALNKIQIKSRQNNNQQKINILNYSKQIKQKTINSTISERIRRAVNEETEKKLMAV